MDQLHLLGVKVLTFLKLFGLGPQFALQFKGNNMLNFGNLDNFPRPALLIFDNSIFFPELGLHVEFCHSSFDIFVFALILLLYYAHLRQSK